MPRDTRELCPELRHLPLRTSRSATSERASEPTARLVHLREPHPLSIMPAGDGTASRRL
jgi:hypothetical protein